MATHDLPLDCFTEMMDVISEAIREAFADAQTTTHRGEVFCNVTVRGVQLRVWLRGLRREGDMMRCRQVDVTYHGQPSTSSVISLSVNDVEMRALMREKEVA